MIEQLLELFIKCGRKISTDSRHIEKGSIFFALKGQNFNGNAFAIDALNKGAAYCVIDDTNIDHKNCLLVKDVLTCMQQLANLYRKKSGFNVIGITGTNGKTTTKELIYSVLSVNYRCTATVGNLNNHIGVPLTVLSAPPETEYLIVEIGANHIGEIELLCKIAEPDYGLITNIGKAHLEGFGNYEGVIKAKSELYAYLVANKRPIFQNQNDPVLVNLTKGYSNIKSYGTPSSNCFASNVKFERNLIIEANIDGKSKAINSQLFGKYNVFNILAALKICSYLSVDIDKAIIAIENYLPRNNRSQIKKTKRNTLILDSYNANPTSMQAAIESFSEIQADNKVVILGGMKELGDFSKVEHQRLMKLVTEHKDITPYFIGKEYNEVNLFKGHHFLETNDFYNFITKNQIDNSLILLKGSRANKLEVLVDLL